MWRTKVFGTRGPGKLAVSAAVMLLGFISGCVSGPQKSPPELPKVSLRSGRPSPHFIAPQINYRVFNFTNETGKSARLECSTNLVDWHLLVQLSPARDVTLRVIPSRPVLFFRLRVED
jgi:hypothetical protein